jgi:hypothetical protein
LLQHFFAVFAVHPRAQQFDLREDERLGFPNDFWRELQAGLMFALTA